MPTHKSLYKKEYYRLRGRGHGNGLGIGRGRGSSCGYGSGKGHGHGCCTIESKLKLYPIEITVKRYHG